MSDTTTIPVKCKLKTPSDLNYNPIQRHYGVLTTIHNNTKHQHHKPTITTFPSTTPACLAIPRKIIITTTTLPMAITMFPLMKSRNSNLPKAKLAAK